MSDTSSDPVLTKYAPNLVVRMTLVRFSSQNIA